MNTELLVEAIDWEKVDGLVPVIVQCSKSQMVLMQAFMNQEALRETIETRRMCYWSRTRGELWRKGETSGNVQHLKAIWLDCDGDCILCMVEQIGGGACHVEDKKSCFYKTLTDCALEEYTGAPSCRHIEDDSQVRTGH